LRWSVSLGPWIVDDAKVGDAREQHDKLKEVLFVSQVMGKTVQIIAIDTTKISDQHTAALLWNTTVGTATDTSDLEIIKLSVPGTTAGLARKEMVGLQGNIGTELWRLNIHNVRDMITDLVWDHHSATPAPASSSSASTSSSSSLGNGVEADGTPTLNVRVNMTIGTGSVRYNMGYVGTLIHAQLDYHQ
jgi:hypothetical protein